jgi:hypothetical protein
MILSDGKLAAVSRMRIIFALAMSILAIAMNSIAGVADASTGTTTGTPQIPICDRKLGTLSVEEPQNSWWTEYHLDSPEALIKVMVFQSKCFTLVDRGKGLQAAQSERALASGGELAGGANVGRGQMTAADYVLVPDISNRNRNSSGANVGAVLAAFIPHGYGQALGGLSVKSKTADVVLTLTDVRSTEQVALEQGHAKKFDLGWTSSGGGAGFLGPFIAGGAGSYANTEIGQVVMQAYLDAYSRLVNDVRNLAPVSSRDNAVQTVMMSKPGRLYAQADLKSEVVRNLDSGMTLYPTGNRIGVWWEATDELGNDGWVPSTYLRLAN